MSYAREKGSVLGLKLGILFFPIFPFLGSNWDEGKFPEVSREWLEKRYWKDRKVVPFGFFLYSFSLHLVA
jgi:hypothetical protein